MKKYILILLGLYIFFYGELYSQIVPIETANKVAKTFLNYQPNSKSELLVKNLGDNELPTMYAFSAQDRWVIISADKRVHPILAYSDENNGEFPDEDERSEEMNYLLEWYSNQIKALRNAETAHTQNSQWEEYLNDYNQRSSHRSVIVGPLLMRSGNENIWKQNGNDGGSNIEKSYNKFCPGISNMYGSCLHTVVGCVALSTAQIMWYWQWPYAAMALNNQLVRYYDWALMPYHLTDSSPIEQADMVANLLHDVGVTVSMNYTCNNSYAEPADVVTALENVYHYNTQILKNRNSYSNSTWINLIKTDLNENRPVLYGGESFNMGHHLFVIDGYDSNNKFHVNFGSTLSNGYYSIDTIYFNDNQIMISGISPNYPSCSPTNILSTDVWPTNFLIQNGGSITIGNRTIANGMQGFIFSGESVTLTSGVTIEAGSQVLIDVKDMHCDDNREVSSPPDGENRHRVAPRKDDRSIVDHQSSTKILRDGQILILRGDRTYTLTGLEVK